MPRLFRFEVGDLVYIQREARQATEPKTFPTVLVIVGFKDNGLAVLEGRDARQITVPVIRLAPCHLLNIDGPDNRPRRRCRTRGKQKTSRARSASRSTRRTPEAKGNCQSES